MRATTLTYLRRFHVICHLSSHRLPGGAFNVLFWWKNLDVKHWASPLVFCFRYFFFSCLQLAVSWKLTLCFLHFMEKLSSTSTQSAGTRGEGFYRDVLLIHLNSSTTHTCHFGLRRKSLQPTPPHKAATSTHTASHTHTHSYSFWYLCVQIFSNWVATRKAKHTHSALQNGLLLTKLVAISN